jgi:hypothetical protein
LYPLPRFDGARKFQRLGDLRGYAAALPLVKPPGNAPPRRARSGRRRIIRIQKGLSRNAAPGPSASRRSSLDASRQEHTKESTCDEYRIISSGATGHIGTTASPRCVPQPAIAPTTRN